MRSHIRDADIAGRYGGEEFAVLLPDTNKNGARVFCERLRQAVEAETVQHEGQTIQCTISLGVADLSKPTSDYKSLIEWADQALYQSKKNGRNQVSVDE
jgi:diguanylate cyclase (GGDEF)-like protein